MRTRLPIALILASALGSAGCVDDDKMFYIRQNLTPSAGCELAATGSVGLAAGTLDVSGGKSYEMYPVVVNDMVATEPQDGEPERNRLHMRGFEVSLDVPIPIPDELANFFRPATSTIDPGGTWILKGLSAIPYTTAQALNIPAGQYLDVTVNLRAVAKRSGDDMESATFPFVVAVCNGCLVDFRAQCPADDDATIKRNACGRPQDEKVTCCPEATSSELKCFKTGAQ